MHKNKKPTTRANRQARCIHRTSPLFIATPRRHHLSERHLARRQLGQQPLRPLAASRSRDLLALPLALLDALVLLADLLGGAAAVGDGGGVAVVGVDADEVGRQAVGLYVLDDDVARAAVARAVAARAVELAGVDDGHAVDGHGAAAVVLDDLVDGARGAAALDEDVAVAEGGDGIFSVSMSFSKKLGNGGHTLAHLAEPDVGQRAGALAVDALELVRADDDIAQAGAVLEDEDGRVGARVGVRVARAAAVELLVAVVDGAADDRGLGEGDDAAGAGGDVEALGRGEGREGGGGGDGELHGGGQQGKMRDR